MFHNIGLIEQVLPTLQFRFRVPFLHLITLLSRALGAVILWSALWSCLFWKWLLIPFVLTSGTFSWSPCSPAPIFAGSRLSSDTRVLSLQRQGKEGWGCYLFSHPWVQAGKWLHSWTFKNKLHMHCGICEINSALAHVFKLNLRRSKHAPRLQLMVAPGITQKTELQTAHRTPRQVYQNKGRGLETGG